MRVFHLHSWDVDPIEAKVIQNRLRRRIIVKNDFEAIRTIAGVHCYHNNNSGLVKTAVVVMSYPDLNLVETSLTETISNFPYMQGLYAFREGPSILSAIEQLGTMPDVFIFSGHGYAHPRRFGLASHIGVILNVVSIGCAKTSLIGRYVPPPDTIGAFSYVTDDLSKEILGAALCSEKLSDPIFISVGHRMTLHTAIDIITPICKSRLPEPLNRAIEFSSSTV